MKCIYRNALCVLLTFICFFGHTASLKGTLVGRELRWDNALVDSGAILPQEWFSTSGLGLPPIGEWRPAFLNSEKQDIVFQSDQGVTVTTEFTLTSVEFRYSDHFQGVDDPSSLVVCPYQQNSSGYSSVGYMASSSAPQSYCVSNTLLVSNGESYRPFDFVRSRFRLDHLVEDFSLNLVPEGKYYASVTLPVAYMMLFGDVETYQIGYVTLPITIDYKPSFIESVNIFGDGVFNLEYNTDEHHVSGESDFKVNVDGHLTSGLKMTFYSSNERDVFDLVNEETNQSIPYSLTCPACAETKVVHDGTKLEEYSLIPFTGEHLQFDLHFSFDNLSYGEVDEGIYKDAVTILFELDI
ncbi:conserved putative inner membrane hypothetical protein [Vibrio harveyi]|uniref:hypothetical protein n=1 Tax=Vibrio harveyi TaxID=669 RepID=UPI002ADCCEE9|nr:hypothetical protein [Vibrio harveyi]CAK6716405.1 conserved putative inner membrane hypothetical protein [Vibrio harveyi]